MSNFALEKKANCVTPDPKFPPAPVSPEIRPNDLLDTKGTIPYVAPHAACVPMEKSIIATTAIGSDSALPSQMQNTPPSVWKIQSVQSLPLMPKILADRSDAYPPNGRANMFAIPNVAAIVPAVCSFNSNLKPIH